MKKSISSLLMLSLIFSLFSACEKSDDLNPNEEGPQKTIYSIEELTYSLQGNDGTELVPHTLPTITISNSTSSVKTVTYNDDGKDYPTTSQFTFEQPLPQEIQDSIYAVKTPIMIDGNTIYYSDKGWQLTTTKQTRPYETSKSSETVGLPAKTKLLINPSYKEEILRASFVLKLRNEATGAINSYIGKWQGTLNIKDLHTSVQAEEIKN